MSRLAIAPNTVGIDWCLTISETGDDGEEKKERTKR